MEGFIEACRNIIEQGNMLVSKIKDTCNINLGPDLHILLFGGLPFSEERFINWDFVSSDKDKIEKAKENWKNKKFLTVSNDDSYIPLPDL